MIGIDEGGSGMFAASGHDVVLAIDDDEDEDGETGEPPALLPFSQLFDVDGRRTSAERLLVEPVEFVGEIIFGRGICF